MSEILANILKTDFYISEKMELSMITGLQLRECKSGFKLGPGSREKWLLPPGKLGRSDSQIGRSYSAKIMTFSVSLEAKAIKHTK